jgi:serine O-acetyltransferase
MPDETWLDDLMPGAIAGLAKCRQCPFAANTEKGLNLPGRRAVCDVLEQLIHVLFPGCHGFRPAADHTMDEDLAATLRQTAATLKEQVRRALEYQCTVEPCKHCGRCEESAREAVAYVIRGIPRVQETLQRDINAAYEGDPAARSNMEIVMSYPGLYAITVHRVAHLLYEREVPLIPRIMSEHAHSLTGIDIHPGARIGGGFFIDHGTGVVIGETCVIGANVKLYQGVTLGALSFEKDAQGRLIKGVKRHPEVRDHVVIYAGATILGGNTVIGEHAVIGGNVWLTHSVPPGSIVYNQQPNPLIREAGGRVLRAGDGSDPGAGI